MGTASLKFRQFKSAVCDAFWGDFDFLRSCGGVVCLFGICGAWGLPCEMLGFLGYLFFDLCIVGLMGGAWLFG